MVNLNDAVSMLRAKREELVTELAAVDEALAALIGVGGSVGAAPGETSSEAAEETERSVVPTRLDPPRTLSDDHKHAMKEGRRKARHSREAAAGLAREMPDPAPGLAPASRADSRPPRLVKRTKRQS